MARIVDSGGASPASHSACGGVAARASVGANPALLRLLQSRSVLLLQGPLGPFFDRLAVWLAKHDVRVSRVAFQSGDVHDAKVLKPIRFQGKLDAWPVFFDELIQSTQADCIVLFGQVRHYHRVAIERARAQGLTIVVLEEGYIRPGYLTMELDGVNGYSSTLQQYLWDPTAQGAELILEKPLSTEGQFWLMARHAMAHYWALSRGARHFPHYQHHKSSSVGHYCRYWVTSWIRKQLHRWQDDRRVQWLAKHPFYLVPLQHDGDSQITHHSRFGENTEFIIEVLRSFADHAPNGTFLVFKQHPFARGGPGHAALIHSLARELGVGDRVLHLVEGHTPTLVKDALAVVVINSTVGLQTLLHRKPLMVLGDAIYAGPGITHQGTLQDFWQNYHAPLEPLVSQLVDQIVHLTQVPCNVYGPLSEPLRWSLHSRRAEVDHA